jgi:hypothetical protein
VVYSCGWRVWFGRLGSDYGRFGGGIGRIDGCFSRLEDSLVVSMFVMVV